VLLEKEEKGGKRRHRVAGEIQNVRRCDKSGEGVCWAESESMCMSNEACLNWRVLEMNLMQRKSLALTQAMLQGNVERYLAAFGSLV